MASRHNRQLSGRRRRRDKHSGTMMSEKSHLQDTCFLCKRRGATTEEHVFPKWLQRQFNMWNQGVVLKNGTHILYKDLRVPCCEDCNTRHLALLERQISALVAKGDPAEFLAKRDATFIWLYKLMYGIHYKELFLLNDRTDPNSGTIGSLDEFAGQHSYNVFPLFARGEVTFEGFSPYSLFVFRLSDTTSSMFHYASEPYKMYAAAVLGSIGMVASFQDDGYIAQDIERSEILQGRRELPVAEFADFAAFVLHLKARMRMLPNYLVTKEPGRYVFRIQPPPADRYSEFDPRVQCDLTRQLFEPCFRHLIREDQDGRKHIDYRPPFRYF